MTKAALGKLKNSKVSGSYRIFLKIVKAAMLWSSEEHFLDLMYLHCLGRETGAERVANAILVSIPKKSSLSMHAVAITGEVLLCWMWWSILCLKFQEKLQQLVEEELPKSQCT